MFQYPAITHPGDVILLEIPDWGYFTTEAIGIIEKAMPDVKITWVTTPHAETLRVILHYRPSGEAS